MKSNEEWLRTLYVCLLVIAFIALATIGAQRAFALSPLPAGGWELKEDDAGMPVMINNDRDKGVVFSFGYQGSKNCSDVRMIIGNLVPGDFADAPKEEVKIPSAMSTPNEETIPLPAIPVTFMEVSDNTVLMLYVYTPTDKLLMELMNAPVFTWTDPSFKAGNRSQFNNEAFVGTLNSMMEQCVKILPLKVQESLDGGWSA